MDIRIVNACNNNCKYCLEQSLRKKDSFIDKSVIFNIISSIKADDSLYFYGGNALLHPELIEIVEYTKKKGFINIGILTNSYGMTGVFLGDLKESGVNSFGIYFNSLIQDVHKSINQSDSVSVSGLLNNISETLRYNFGLKMIIHINGLNIKTIYRDIIFLYKKYKILNFEFINYFPFGRAYDLYKADLSYSIVENRKKILMLFKVIKRYNFEVKFSKFSKDFFHGYNEYYNMEESIINQIGDEDNTRLSSSITPTCFFEKRCENCFIKDVCKFYPKLEN